MNENIFSFYLENEQVLGFDTGLKPEAFAKGKLPELLTQSGSIVYPDGKTETWRPGGVVEGPNGSIVIWGPFFPVEVFDFFNTQNNKNETLTALRAWLNAWILLNKNSESQAFPGLEGVFISAQGAIFFPPKKLLERVIKTKRGIHPDLDKEEVVSFCSGFVLYNLFCAAPPFSDSNVIGSNVCGSNVAGSNVIDSNEKKLLKDIREGAFVPPSLAAPGLEEKMCRIISSALNPDSKNNRPGKRPSPETILELLKPSKIFSSWFRQLNNEELLKIRKKRELFIKRQNIKTKTGHFVKRNTLKIAVSFFALLIILFSAKGIINRKTLPSVTIGLDPVQVAEVYYNAFNELDHNLMEACVKGKAGKEDIRLITNFAAVNKIRKAYEPSSEVYLSAEEWLRNDCPLISTLVFGITGLEINLLSIENENEHEKNNAYLEAKYTFWAPEKNTVTDKIHLTYKKDYWLISDIKRTKI